MKDVDRWLLPDGIEEMLPKEAAQIENLRRSLIDVFQTWGYDYVMPPLMEFCDSLLTGSGEDVSLLTFKLTDQISGKLMGLRADITPQVARMDAHSLHKEGVSRLCYAGHVAHTRAKEPLSSRTPIQVGVELFGSSGMDADVEVVSLLLHSLQVAGLEEQYIDLGHVGVFRALSELAGLNSLQEQALFELLQAKATSDIEVWLKQEITDTTVRDYFIKLTKCAGDASILDKALDLFKSAPEQVTSPIKALRELAVQIKARYPSANLYFDLSELRGYNYHTGMVFGAFAPGVGAAIARGGRYDHIGEAFGRARPARGFAMDLNAIHALNNTEIESSSGIFVPAALVEQGWSYMQTLRAQGKRVVTGLSDDQAQPDNYDSCNQILVESDGELIIQNIKQS